MPYVRLETSANCSEETRHTLCSMISKAVAKEIGKPEKYVMVAMETATMSMSGNQDPAAFVDVRSIGGLNKAVNQKLATAICGLLSDKLGVTGDRVYLNFSDVAASNWGCDGSTFG